MKKSSNSLGIVKDELPRGEQRRRLLIAATQEMIAERGPSGVSTRELARRVGVSEALIFHHFKNKAGLLAAAAISQETLLARMTAYINGPPSDDLGRDIDDLAAAGAARMRPGTPGWAMLAVMTAHDEQTAELRGEALVVLDSALHAFAGWLDQSGGLRTDGLVAAYAFFEAILFAVATLPDDPKAWDTIAPKTFASLAQRWRSTHLEN